MKPKTLQLGDLAYPEIYATNLVEHGNAGAGNKKLNPPSSIWQITITKEKTIYSCGGIDKEAKDLILADDFLAYLSEKFDRRYQELVRDFEGFDKA